MQRLNKRMFQCDFCKCLEFDNTQGFLTDPIKAEEIQNGTSVWCWVLRRVGTIYR